MQKARTTLSSIFDRGIVDAAKSKEEILDADANKEKEPIDKESTQEERRDNDLSEKSEASFVFSPYYVVFYSHHAHQLVPDTAKTNNGNETTKEGMDAGANKEKEPNGKE